MQPPQPLSHHGIFPRMVVPNGVPSDAASAPPFPPPDGVLPLIVLVASSAFVNQLLGIDF
ncbi:hypothetical protein LINGRAPRIM_LOCUS1048 [Linum grandiflorum]